MVQFATEALGMAAATLTSACWVPQAIRILRTRDTRAISLITQTAFAGGTALWLSYGFMIDSKPVIAANTVTLILALSILILKIRFG
jgi:MtN3 and saliva related transmembrane protein